ncbi:MAG: hypothetical protein HKN04_05430 [Rhodothermaceae bacterium]|nr:hypothetical protein [Rhodothermaceae bacterium]
MVLTQSTEAFYDDTRMYASTFALALEQNHLASTHQQMRASAAALPEQFEAELIC